MSLTQLNNYEPLEKQAGKLLQFMSEMEQITQRTGMRILAQAKKTSAQALTTSLTVLKDLEAAFTPSGGLVLIVGFIFVGQTTAASASTHKLEIKTGDDYEPVQTRVVDLGFSRSDTLPFFYPAVLPTVPHAVRFRSSNATNTTTVSASSVESNLYVLEFNGGT